MDFIAGLMVAIRGCSVSRCVIVSQLPLSPSLSFSSVPHRSVKQEFIPTNVDEAEFEVSVNGPEGTNLAVMNETITAMEKDMFATPGVRLVLSSVGGNFLGGVNQGGAYVRIAPHEERTFSLTKLWNETKKGNPLNAFKGNYTQQDVMTEMRRRLQKYAPCVLASETLNHSTLAQAAVPTSILFFVALTLLRSQVTPTIDGSFATRWHRRRGHDSQT